MLSCILISSYLCDAIPGMRVNNRSKAVKMLGFTDVMTERIQNLRAIELDLSTKFRKIMTIRVGAGKHQLVLVLQNSCYERSRYTQQMLHLPLLHSSLSSSLSLSHKSLANPSTLPPLTQRCLL